MKKIEKAKRERRAILINLRKRFADKQGYKVVMNRIARFNSPNKVEKDEKLKTVKNSSLSTKTIFQIMDLLVLGTLIFTNLKKDKLLV